MLTNFLYKYISNDKDCLLGLIPDTRKYALLLSPLNANFLYPEETSSANTNWVINKNIINPTNVSNSDKTFQSSTTSSDWSIETSLNILGNTTTSGNNFTFTSKINIDTTNIGNDKVQIFKQGTDNLNGIIDIYFDFNRSTDSTGALDKLVINVYYQVPSDASSINVQTFECSNIGLFVNKNVQLTVIVDSTNDKIKILADDTLVGSKTMELTQTLDLPLNTPADLSMNRKLTLGGSKYLKMKNAFIWKRALTIQEIQFLNKLI